MPLLQLPDSQCCPLSIPSSCRGTGFHSCQRWAACKVQWQQAEVWGHVPPCAGAAICTPCCTPCCTSCCISCCTSCCTGAAAVAARCIGAVGPTSFCTSRPIRPPAQPPPLRPRPPAPFDARGLLRRQRHRQRPLWLPRGLGLHLPAQPGVERGRAARRSGADQQPRRVQRGHCSDAASQPSGHLGPPSVVHLHRQHAADTQVPWGSPSFRHYNRFH